MCCLGSCSLQDTFVHRSHTWRSSRKYAAQPFPVEVFLNVTSVTITQWVRAPAVTYKKGWSCNLKQVLRLERKCVFVWSSDELGSTWPTALSADGYSCQAEAAGGSLSCCVNLTVGKWFILLGSWTYFEGWEKKYILCNMLCFAL